MSIESLRIAWLVGRRIGHGEDARYAELRARWRVRGREQASFAALFQAQALAAAFLSLPFLLAAFNEHDGLEPLEWAGAALWVLAVSCEAVADRQLASFKRRPESAGRTMRAGLWRYSRHPNYFFQWLTWVAYALGRRLEYYDHPAVRQIVRDAAADDYRWSSLILGIVKSPPFLMRARQTGVN